jgi:hypothetical protein
MHERERESVVATMTRVTIKTISNNGGDCSLANRKRGGGEGGKEHRRHIDEWKDRRKVGRTIGRRRKRGKEKEGKEEGERKEEEGKAEFKERVVIQGTLLIVVAAGKKKRKRTVVAGEGSSGDNIDEGNKGDLCKIVPHSIVISSGLAGGWAGNGRDERASRGEGGGSKSLLPSMHTQL